MGKDAEVILEEALATTGGTSLAGGVIAKKLRGPMTIDTDAETAWAKVLERRMYELDSGAARPVALSDARKTIMEVHISLIPRS